LFVFRTNCYFQGNFFHPSGKIPSRTPMCLSQFKKNLVSTTAEFFTPKDFCDESAFSLFTTVNRIYKNQQLHFQKHLNALIFTRCFCQLHDTDKSLFPAGVRCRFTTTRRVTTVLFLWSCVSCRI